MRHQGLYVPGVFSLGRRRGLIVPSSLARLALHSRMVVEGDSITAGSVSAQWSEFAIGASGGRLSLPQNWNQAVGGQTAAQMATQIAATMTPAPKLVCFLAGTNDLGGTSDTPATIYANIRTCVKGYLDGGAQYVVVSRVLPRNDASFLALAGGTRTADLTALNVLIAGLPNDSTLLAAGYAGRVVIASDLTSSLNPTTECVDGLHPNYLGAVKLGQSFANGINQCVALTSLPTDGYLNADNILLAARNPALNGTAGTKSGTGPVTGSVADTWTASENGGMAVACSKVTLNSANAQRLVVSGTNSTANRVVNFSAAASVSGAIGDAFECCVDFSLAAGYQNLRNIVVNASTCATPNNGNMTVQMDGAGALSGTLRTAVGTPLAATISTITMQCYLAFNAGTVAADITWGRPYMRKVPAGQ